MLLSYDVIETRTAELKKVEDEVKRIATEVGAIQKELDDQVAAHKAQLQELETAIVAAENLIPEEYREKYRRIVGRYGADALAVCENASCHGCFTSITSQMINDLINGTGLSFCLSTSRLRLPHRARSREHASYRGIAVTEMRLVAKWPESP